MYGVCSNHNARISYPYLLMMTLNITHILCMTKYAVLHRNKLRIYTHKHTRQRSETHQARAWDVISAINANKTNLCKYTAALLAPNFNVELAQNHKPQTQQYIEVVPMRLRGRKHMHIVFIINGTNDSLVVGENGFVMHVSHEV